MRNFCLLVILTEVQTSALYTRGAVGAFHQVKLSTQAQQPQLEAAGAFILSLEPRIFDNSYKRS